MRDPMHKTVCNRCWRGTWYETEQACRMSRMDRCKCCGQTTKEIPCGGTLKAIDRSELAPAFAGYYESGDRIRVMVDGEIKTGTVGKTGGWKPSYMLMARIDSNGSSDLLDHNDRVLAVKRGNRYQQVSF